jgi:hypothetical protein
MSDLGTGEHYCLLVNKLFYKLIPEESIIYSPKYQVQFEHNMKLVQ